MMLRDILAIYQGLGHMPQFKTAGEYAGPCPECGGRDRFVIFVNQGKDGLGRFWCRGCGRGGDAVQFLREFLNMGFREACRELGREPPEDARPGVRQASLNTPRPVSWEPRANSAPAKKWQEKAGVLVAWAERQLQANTHQLRWLQEERGIRLETTARARLGWIPKNLFLDREAWGLPPAVKQDGSSKKHFIPEGLLIPVFSPSGGVLRLKVRRFKPGPNGPKYLPIPSEPKNIAPLLVQAEARAWAVVESELCALLLAQEAGDLVNVAALGSAVYRPDAELFPQLVGAPFVLVSLDFDEAGNKAAWAWWSEHFPPKNCRVWPVPEGKDPSEAWQLGWELRSWIEAGLPPALALSTRVTSVPPLADVAMPAPQGTGQAEEAAPSPGGLEAGQENAAEDCTPEEAWERLRRMLPKYDGQLVRYVDYRGKTTVGLHFEDGLRDLDLAAELYALFAQAGGIAEHFKDRLPLGPK